MNHQNNTRSTEIETPTYTDLTFRRLSAACSAKLEALKNRLVQRLTAEFSDLEALLVSQAVDEAQALAALTVVPHLILPSLAEEKVQTARNWARHQQAIYRQPALAYAA